MYDLLVHSYFNLELNLKTPIPSELYVDKPQSLLNNKSKILWVIEPDEVSGVKKNILKNYKNFDLILTWDEEILNQCENSKLYPFGTSWVSDFYFNEKEYKITTLVGGKSFLRGHKIRHELPEILENSKVPVDIFNSINSPYLSLKEVKTIKDPIKKNELFYSQYHIAIENVFKKNYFTEKLIDCFQTKTIPIYMGCPNIGEFFNTNGMFIVNSIDEIVSVVNSLNPETYNQKLKFVEENYEKSFEYSNFRERIKKEIIKYCELY